MKKFFLAAFTALALWSTPVKAELYVTVRDPRNNYVPEYGSNPHFKLAYDLSTRFIYFDVRVTNTGTTDEVIYQVISDLTCVDNTLFIDPNLVLDQCARPPMQFTLRPGQTKIFTKYSMRDCQRLNACFGLPDGLYSLNVRVNDTFYSEIVQFDNQDLYFVTDTNTY